MSSRRAPEPMRGEARRAHRRTAKRRRVGFANPRRMWSGRGRENLTQRGGDPASLTHSPAVVALPFASSVASLRRYVQRKVREEFQKNVALSGEDLAVALAKARADKAVIDRQVEVYKMFGSPVRSILELGKK